MATVKLTFADYVNQQQTTVTRTFVRSESAQAYLQTMYLNDADSILAVELTIEGNN